MCSAVFLSLGAEYAFQCRYSWPIIRFLKHIGLEKGCHEISTRVCSEDVDEIQDYQCRFTTSGQVFVDNVLISPMKLYLHVS